MQRRNCILLSIAFFLIFGSNAHAIRCNNDLITENDSTFEVVLTLAKCGSVLDKELIRSADTGRKIEKWLIRVNEWGNPYCYELTFVDAVLRDIEWIGRCD